MDVLLIDDDEDMRFVVAFALEKDGMAVRTAATGAEGVEAALEEPPDLILLDRFLENDSGAVLARLRSSDETRDVPVIWLTGRTEGLEASAERGILGVLSKPFDPSRLAADVRGLMQGNG